MGNAAGVEQSLNRRAAHLLPATEYARIERLCNSGYFSSRFDEYRTLMERMVQVAALDVLEILLPCNPKVRLAYPLHLAARYGKLECLELFISAGFNSLLLDDESRTPLHLVCTNRSAEAALCVSFLCIQGGKALSMRDSHGSTPLHIAVERNNERILTSLLPHIDEELFAAPNFKGKSALNLAKSLQNFRLAHLLEEHHQNKRNFSRKQQVSSSSTRKHANSSSSGSGPVEQKRIMAIWERFFENAFKAMCEGDDGLMLDHSGFDQAAQTVAPASVAVRSFLPEPRESSITSNMPPRPGSCDSRVREWLEWTLCYDSGEKGAKGGKGAYYAIHARSGETLWLEDHISAQVDMGLCSSYWRETPLQSLPTNAHDLVRLGWMAFFDPNENTCTWLQLSNGTSEAYLPLGGDPSLSELDLVSYDQDGIWLCPDQTPTRNWSLVIMVDEGNWKHADHDSKGDDEGYYYRNIVTNHSRWSPPPQWEEITKENDGWVWCVEEGTGHEYWWHMETGDAQWSEF
jgi:hypothetical protein